MKKIVNLAGATAIAASSLVGIGAAAAPTQAQAATCNVYYAPGTRVSPYQSQQVMVADRTSGTKGTWARYEWRGYNNGCWVKVNASSASVFGRGGVVDGRYRRQGTNTTPAGTYAIKYAFGVGNPGTKMGYRKVTSCSNWVQVYASDYNRWRESCASNYRVGEHLASYTGSLYRQAAVIGYNYDSPVKGKGSGIFLHYAQSYTGGCVGLNNRTELTNTIKWMNPAKHPVIVIKA